MRSSSRAISLENSRGQTQHLDSERFKMGCRIALIRKRFYKTRDCKKFAESRHVSQSSREALWLVLLVVV